MQSCWCRCVMWLVSSALMHQAHRCDATPSATTTLTHPASHPQENYINHRPAIARDDATRLRAMAKAADCISQGDLLNRSIRQFGNWGLMPAAALVGTVMPATYMRGFRETFGLYPGEQNFPRFTSWLGNFSSSNKQRRWVVGSYCGGAGGWWGWLL